MRTLIVEDDFTSRLLCDGYLTKPIEKAKLIDALHKLQLVS